MAVCRVFFNFSIELFFDAKNESIITTVNPFITFKSKRAWNKINCHKEYVKQE